MSIPDVPESIREPFSGLVTQLFQSFSSTTKCLKLDNCLVIAGEVIEFGHDFIHLMQAPFVPAHGFLFGSKDCQQCTIHLPRVLDRSIALRCGAHVVISGPSCSPTNDQ